MKFLLFPLVAIFLGVLPAQAQLPFQFIHAANIDNGGSAKRIAVAPDGTVYLANGTDGLRAYTFNGSQLINTGHAVTPSYFGVSDVFVGSDGTIFLADTDEGLCAYAYDGSTFAQKGQIDYEGSLANGVTVGPDGTIFLANGNDGLRAFTYDGDSFTNTAHIYEDGHGWQVAVGLDGTVFLANGTGGLRAYTYDGSSFTNTAHIVPGGGAGTSNISVGSGGTLFVSVSWAGLRAYNYDGSSFTYAGSVNHGDHYNSAQGTCVAPDGTVFLANYEAGLYAMSFNGNSFTDLASINDPGSAWSVALGSDGIVFLANRTGGLRAYFYDGFAIVDSGPSVPRLSALEQNFPNPFNPSTQIVFTLPEQAVASVRIYDISGQLVTNLLSPETMPAGRHQIRWNGRNKDGLPMPSGTYFYRLEAGGFHETKSMVLTK